MNLRTVLKLVQGITQVLLLSPHIVISQRSVELRNQFTLILLAHSILPVFAGFAFVLTIAIRITVGELCKIYFSEVLR